MIDRHKKLGFKQTIQKKWMDKTVQMMLSGLTEQEIRLELDEYLSNQKQSGGIGDRGKKTYGMAIALLSSWFSPDSELIPFRNDALNLAKEYPSDEWLPLHWAVLSASYPFYYYVARQAGRLLNLQEQVTQAQIFNRLKEHYGDRETVARNARYAVRSIVAWGGLKDSGSRGCYEKGTPFKSKDYKITILMYEAALLAMNESKCEISLLSNNPAYFSFQLQMINGDLIAQRSKRIEVVRYGPNDELLKLK